MWLSGTFELWRWLLYIAPLSHYHIISCVKMCLNNHDKSDFINVVGKQHNWLIRLWEIVYYITPACIVRLGRNVCIVSLLPYKIIKIQQNELQTICVFKCETVPSVRNVKMLVLTHNTNKVRPSHIILQYFQIYRMCQIKSKVSQLSFFLREQLMWILVYNLQVSETGVERWKNTI